MNKRTKNVVVCSLIGLIIGLFLLVYNAYKETDSFLILKKLELKSYDARLSFFQKRYKDSGKFRTIIFTIDDDLKETSEEIFDGKSLKRDALAEIIEKLAAQKVKVIGLDMLFISDTDEDDPGNLKLLNTIKKYRDKIVLASEVKYMGSSTAEGSKYTTSFYDMFPENTYGAVNIQPDIDGFIRTFSYSFPYKGFDFSEMKEKEKFAPGFPTVIVNRFKPEFIEKRLIDSNNPEKKYINFIKHGDNRRTYRSLTDLFSKNSSLESLKLKNKVVIIGNALKVAHDYYDIPLLNTTIKSCSERISEHSMPGVEIQANIIDTILNNEIIKDLDFKTNCIIVIFLCVLLGALLGLNRGIVYSIIVPFGFIAFYMLYAVRIFEHNHLVALLSTPVFQFILITSFCWVFLYFRENKTRIYIYNSFRKYVSPEVAKIASNEIEQLSSQRKKITLLFSDIAGFTTISEQTDPAELTDLLNKYFTRMGQIIFRNEGTLDKYIGDAVMAFWGAPLDITDPEYKACIAALEMQSDIKELNKEFEKRNFPPFTVRIGINTAEVMVGNLGGDLFNYTAIGDGVNLASRLEGVNKKFNTSIIISEYTYEKVKERLICRALGEIIVKGKAESVKVYELLGFQYADITDNKKISELFSQGLAEFKNKKWDEAEEIFKQILALKPDDKVSQLYIDQIQLYKENDPGDDWDGIIELKEK